MARKGEESAPRERRFAVAGHVVAAPVLDSGLYVVATPIGNLRDITLRALEVLAAADLVACEDTRVSSVLLRHYGISAPLTPYHEHNAAEQRPRLLEALGEGKAVALVSDAGTPLISDPGFRLVGEARAAGHAVIPIPGASSVLAGLVASGLPTDTFLFAGFLPTKGGPRGERLKTLAAVPGTLVFFEAPHRVGATLAAMAEAYGGDRRAVVARELTKMFEETVHGTLAELTERYASEAPRGEVVILVAPPSRTAVVDPDEVDRLLKALLAEHPVAAAASEAATITGLPRRDLYRRALDLKGKGDGDR